MNDLSIQQSEQYEGDDWWNWSVWLTGPDETLDQIDFVEWTLHPSFPNPVRRVKDRSSNFRLETGGWGTFPIHARIRMKGASTDSGTGSDLKLRHELALHYPNGRMTEA